MNYKSKLLSVFLSAGILLNSTSMAFAYRDLSHLELSGRKSIGGSVKAEKFHTKKSHTKVNDPKWEYRDGWLVMEGTELSSEQGEDEEEGKIDYVYYEETKTLWIYGNGCHTKSYDPSDQERPIWEKYIDSADIEHLVIDGVEGIKDYAFMGYSNVKTLELSEGLYVIGSGAFFGCKNLTTVKIPSSVHYIWRGAFEDCGLTSLELQEGLEFIGYHAFYGNRDLRTVTIPSSVEMIGQRAFYLNLNLEIVVIPNSIKCIGQAAFGGLPALKSITLPRKFKSRIDDILEDTKDNKDLKIEYTIEEQDKENDITFTFDEETKTLYIKGKGGDRIKDYGLKKRPIWEVYINRLEIEHLVIDGVKLIGDYAFAGYFNVKTLELSEGLYNIGIGAFLGAENLTAVKIPSSVRNIEWNAFFMCGLTSLELPEGLYSIGNCAFYGNRNLRTVTIPSNVREIGNQAFKNLPALTSITLPKRFEEQINAILGDSKDNEGLKIEYTG